MLRTGLVLAIAMTASAQSYAQASSDLARCAELEDGAARLACYDEISNRQMPAEPEAAVEPAAPTEPEAPAAVAKPVEAAAPPVAEQPKPLTDEVGQEQLERKDRPPEKPETFAGRVSNCRQDGSEKWYFFFDNGQVWKQADSDKLRFRNCDFEAAIRKDFFGYKMDIVGDDKEVRVSRVR